MRPSAGWTRANCRVVCGAVRPGDSAVRGFPSKFGEFIGAQFGVITPILLVVMLIALWQMRLSDPGRLLFWFSIPILALFAAKSLQGRVQGHWALPAYLGVRHRDEHLCGTTLAVILARQAVDHRGGVALALAASIAIHFPARLRWPIKVDPMRRLTGWASWATQ